MSRYLLAAAALMMSLPVSAATVFSDNFNGENGGASSLNYNRFANFNVIGNVDLVANGDFGLGCVGGGGSCVDLDGTNGPGEMVSKASFAFNAGDTVRLSVDISGNQGRSSAPDLFNLLFEFNDFLDLISYGNNFSGTDVTQPGGNTVSFGVGRLFGSNDPYATRSIFFTAASAGTLKFIMKTDSRDAFGPMIDNVRLEITPQGVPEPTTWAMMIVGFGLIGAGMRRRPTTVAFC